MIIDKWTDSTDVEATSATVNLHWNDFPKVPRHLLQKDGFHKHEWPPARGPVLVVDDEDEIRRLVTDILEEEGYHVVCARNGQEALHYLQTAADLPKLILLDLMMPVMDGPAFRGEQQRDARLKHIPVVVFSAGRNNQQAAALGGAAFIEKPFDYDLLCNTVAIYTRGC